MPKEDWPFCIQTDKADRECKSKAIHGSLYCSSHSMKKLAEVELCPDCRVLLQAAGLAKE